jgi:phage shock protein B
MDVLTFLLTVFMIFVAMPWIIFNSIAQWKKSGALTRDDENLLEELHDLARRLDGRLRTVERIVTAENPDWREIAGETPVTTVEDHNQTLRRIK